MEKAELVLKQKPTQEEALLLKGGCLLAKKEGEQAVRFLKGIVEKGVRVPDAYLMLASAYLLKADTGEAEKALRQGVAGNPKSLALLFGLADFYLKNKRPDDAIAALQEILKIEPGNAPANLSVAGSTGYGKPQNAADALKAYLSGDPKSEDRIIQVAGFYAARQKFDEAERRLTEAIKANEKSFKLRFALADVYGNSGRADRAIETLKQCLALSKDAANPDVIKAKNALAAISLSRQEISRAMTYTEEVLKASPKNVEARFTKGRIHLLRGEGTLAVPEFRAVITKIRSLSRPT